MSPAETSGNAPRTSQMIARRAGSSAGTGWTRLGAHLGAFLAPVLLLLAVGPAAAVATGPFAGTVWSPSLEKELQGCATDKALLPKWSKATGNGSWRATTTAVTCPSYRGGNFFPSSSLAEAELQMATPLHLPGGTGGVNVSWAIDALATTNASLVGTNTSCPTTTYENDADWGYTWYNFTETVAACWAEANVFLYGFASVIDQKTGAAFSPSNVWMEPFNTSGIYLDDYQYTSNYSNASFWSYNSTSSGSFNHSWGGSGGLSGAFDPTWFINGTFVHAHLYSVDTYVYVYADISVSGFAAAKGSASVNLATQGGHWDLLPISVW